MIKAVIFDAFGTLVKVEPGASAKLVMERIREAGADFDPGDINREWKSFYRKLTADPDFMTERQIFESRIRWFYERYGVDRDPAEDNRVTMESFCGRVLYPEAPEAVRKLRSKYRVFIASNTDNDVLEAIMKRHGLQVDMVFTSENFRCYKPSRTFYEKVLEAVGLEPCECVFIGDNPRDDVIGPKQKGMKTILIDRECSGLAPVEADLVLDHIPDKLNF